jgi:DivIVA domain-containing protein
MDMTPDELRKVTFRSTTLAKGYSVTDVDEFVEQVATGIGELLDQLRNAAERAARAEAALSEVRSSDETVQRTLLHAQKLADAVLAEARQEAATVQAEAAEAANRIRAKAREEGAAHVSKARDARTDAERLRGEATVDRERAKAEVEALMSRASAGIDQNVLAEIERLHGVRSTLEADIARLGEWLDEQRSAVRHLLVEAMNVLEGSSVTLADPPTVEPVATSVRLFDPAPAPTAVDDRPTEAVEAVQMPDESGEREAT